MFDSALNTYLRKIPIDRSVRPKMFCKNGVLTNFAKFTRKHLRQTLFFIKKGDRSIDRSIDLSTVKVILLLIDSTLLADPIFQTK